MDARTGDAAELSRTVSRTVAVIGGGVAGAAACLRLRARGAGVLWFAPDAREDDRPGETLAPAARPILADLGLADVLEDPAHRASNSVFSAWGSDRLIERPGVLHLEGPGLVLDRGAFDRALHDGALASGVVPMAARVRATRLGNGHWIIATEQEEHDAAFVIDATGRTAVHARHHARRFRVDRLAALYAFLPQDPRSDVEPTRATLIEAVPDGWWYASLLGDGRLVVNHYTDADLMPGAAALGDLLDAAPLVGRWVAEASFRTDVPLGRASAATTWIAPAAGAGWLAVGDAAAAFDPLSSHGLTTALWGGLHGADAALAARDGDDAALERYAGAVAKGVQQFLSERAALYGQERRFRGRAFWDRRHGAADAALGQLV